MNTDTPNNPEPSELELLTSLATGELDGPQAAALRARINADPALGLAFEKIEFAVRFLLAEPRTVPATEAIKRAKRALAESRPGAIERLAEGLVRVIASLDLDTRLTPAVAGIRGAGATAQLAFSTDEADIDLELAPVSDGQWRVTGQIDADVEGAWQITVVDRASDLPIAEIQSEMGAFAAELTAGSFLFELRRGDLLIEAGPVLVP
ncbi:MAG: anti-sigma factor RsiW [Phycisphaerales bacterium]|jgi:anti-sigma factor RsiW